MPLFISNICEIFGSVNAFLLLPSCCSLSSPAQLMSCCFCTCSPLFLVFLHSRMSWLFLLESSEGSGNRCPDFQLLPTMRSDFRWSCVHWVEHGFVVPASKTLQSSLEGCAHWGFQRLITICEDGRGISYDISMVSILTSQFLIQVLQILHERPFHLTLNNYYSIIAILSPNPALWKF